MAAGRRHALFYLPYRSYLWHQKTQSCSASSDSSRIIGKRKRSGSRKTRSGDGLRKTVTSTRCKDTGLVTAALSLYPSNHSIMENITLINGDCLELIKELPEKSVNLICTNPPYAIGTTSNGQ